MKKKLIKKSRATTSNQASVINNMRVINYLRQKYNPIRNLTPEVLIRQQEAFEMGYLKEFALTAEHIERKDDILVSVAGKRKKAPGTRGYDILTADDSAEAQAHKEALEYFYNNLSATNAVDLNERGEVSMLLRQMMDAVGKRYAVHEIIWQPGLDGITAEVRFAPLWFFENTTGRLRFLESEGALYGTELEAGKWMVTVGDGLMLASSIAYMYKHMPLRDWLIYCGRHGMPGIAGKTSATYNSEEWKAMATAVNSFSTEFSAVMSKNDDILPIDLSAKGELPHPKLIERMDRAMSAIWRGADLSTMSAGSGEGTGASLQGKEADILESDDAAMLSESLRRHLDRYVIQYRFGDVKPLAYISVNTSTRQNIEQDLKIDLQLQTMGFPMSVEDLAERYGRALPDPDEQLLPPPQAPFSPGQIPPVGANAANSKPIGKDNSAAGSLVASARLRLAKAQQAVLLPVAKRLNELYNMADSKDLDQDELRKVLTAFNEQELPKILRTMNADSKTVNVIGETMTAALFNGLEKKAIEVKK